MKKMIPLLTKVAASAIVALTWSHLAFGGEIHDVARAGDLEKVQVLLTNTPDLVFSRDSDGETPLHLAAFMGHKETVELLLANNAEVNATNNYRRMPLHYAAGHGRKEIVQLLLANKAEVNASDKFRDTPLHNAAFNGSKEVVELLLAGKAEVNAKDRFGFTPLHMALDGKHQDVAELLRLHGGHE
jgi:cytohesin